MTKTCFENLWERHSAKYLDFDQVEHKRSLRHDLHAFLLLDELCPMREGYGKSMLSGAEHDEIYLNIDADELAKVVTEAQIIELIRCGVRWGTCFSMLV